MYNIYFYRIAYAYKVKFLRKK